MAWITRILRAALSGLKFLNLTGKGTLFYAYPSHEWRQVSSHVACIISEDNQFFRFDTIYPRLRYRSSTEFLAAPDQINDHFAFILETCERLNYPVQMVQLWRESRTFSEPKPELELICYLPIHSGTA